MPGHATDRQKGVALIALLVAMVIMGLMLSSAGQVWQTTSRREKERDLLFIGLQFRNAIASYRNATPGANKEYPRSLEDLLEDKRFPYPVRHLRKLYRDPITNSKNWGMILAGDRIVAIHSLSEETPLKKQNFPVGLETFAGVDSYRGWVFGGL